MVPITVCFVCFPLKCGEIALISAERTLFTEIAEVASIIIKRHEAILLFAMLVKSGFQRHTSKKETTSVNVCRSRIASS